MMRVNDPVLQLQPQVLTKIPTVSIVPGIINNPKTPKPREHIYIMYIINLLIFVSMPQSSRLPGTSEIFVWYIKQILFLEDVLYHAQWYGCCEKRLTWRVCFFSVHFKFWVRCSGIVGFLELGLSGPPIEKVLENRKVMEKLSLLDQTMSLQRAGFGHGTMVYLLRLAHRYCRGWQQA